MSNIIAEDNSNLVVSPRISFEMLGAGFPRTYELFSGWRFRLYNVRLYATAALFTALFAFTIYVAGLRYQSEMFSSPQFMVYFISGGTYSYDGGTEGGYMHDELLELPGVTGLYKSIVVSADKTRSHILFDKSANVFSIPSFSTYFSADENYSATNLVDYLPADSEVIARLSEYDYDGDLNSLLNNEKTVVISDSAGNAMKLDIKPGDKIKVAKFVSKITNPQDYLSGLKLLGEELKLFTFDYTEYTVGAVIHNIPCGG